MRLARQPRAAALKQPFKPEKTPIGGDDMDAAEGDAAPDSDESANILDIIQEFERRKAKKASVRTMAFRQEFKKLVAAGRKGAQHMSEAGTAIIEEARLKAKEQLRAQHLPNEQNIGAVLQNFKAQNEAMESLLAQYDALFDNLLPRRVNQIDAASATMVQGPINRSRSLRARLRHGQDSLEAAKVEEKRATDAQELIKHVKALMLC